MTINQDKVERWDVLEIVLKSQKHFANPFIDVNLSVQFIIDKTTKKVEGFYDGGGIWKIRFMPEEIGEYIFEIESDNDEFDGLNGKFESIAPSDYNHGPIRVDKRFHFSYADNTPFFVMGTTAYAWTYRPHEVRKKTLDSFVEYGFNKIRMLVFPKYLAGFKEIDLTYEPPTLPYEGEKMNFDYKRFNVEYFRNFEERVKDLLKLGIEADVILFHNYDFGMWGIDDGLNDDDAVLYLKYMIARLSSYRNVWWSLANEYDMYKDPDGSGQRSKLDRRDWDRLGDFIMQNDPYNHLRSIHNWGPIYPNKDWMTHVSYQYPNTYSLLIDLKWKYQKPVINDEYQYEGNLTYGWGNLSGEEEVLRHWLSVMAGGYATHGECYVVDGNKKDIFWTYGGEMVGYSARRLRFLREIVDVLPFQEMEPDHIGADGRTKFLIRKDDEVLLYFLINECRKTRLWLDLHSDVTVYDLLNCRILERFTSNATRRKIGEYSGLIAVKVEKM